MVGAMKYRALLIDPGNLNPERPVQTFANSLETIHEWAYGTEEGGMERPRGVLMTAKSDAACVNVYAMEERQIEILTKRGKPA
jgi:hypothetical protein